METINYVIAFLAGIIAMQFIQWVIIPICDAVLCGIGYMIFNILCTDRTKAMNAPFRYVIVVLKWYCIGFAERLFHGTDGTHTIGKNEWKPYFHYVKR